MSRIPVGVLMALISATPVIHPSESVGDSIATATPQGRSHHVAVWTGEAMIVWGGFVGRQERTNTGAIYTLATGSWKSTSIQGAPPAVDFASVVWTGSEMVVWGGFARGTLVATTVGGRYDPVGDSWKRINSGFLNGRSGHTAIWTGTEMIVFGGNRTDSYQEAEGKRCDPERNKWQDLATAGAPSPRIGHTAIWTGKEMIVWGGYGNPRFATPDPVGYLSTGVRYNPATDTWVALPTREAPSPRMSHTAVWTGKEMIVWGGTGASGALSSGAKYDPTKNAWVPLTTTGAPEARRYHTAVWTGGRMLVWGGSVGETSFDTGAAYDPDRDAWSPLSTTNPPEGREFHTAVWTGKEMIVWGGRRRNGWTYSYLSTGGRYDPSTDRWTRIAGPAR